MLKKGLLVLIIVLLIGIFTISQVSYAMRPVDVLRQIRGPEAHHERDMTEQVFDHGSSERAAKATAYLNQFLGRPDDALFTQTDINELVRRFEALSHPERCTFSSRLLELLYGSEVADVEPLDVQADIGTPWIVAIYTSVIDLSVVFRADPDGPPGSLVAEDAFATVGNTGPHVAGIVRGLGASQSHTLLVGFGSGIEGSFFISTLEDQNRAGIVHMLEGPSRTKISLYIPNIDRPRALSRKVPLTTVRHPLTDETASQLIEYLQDHLPSAVQGDEFVIFEGAIFDRAPSWAITELIELCRSKGYQVVIDLRPGMDPNEMRAVLNASPAVAHVNLEDEFAPIDDLQPDDLLDARGQPKFDEIIERALRVAQDNKIEIFIVSLGEYGAIAIYYDEQGICHAVLVRAAKVQELSSLSAGDSLIAGFVWQRLQGADVPDSLIYGIAAGTATILKPGSHLATKPDEIEAVVAKMREQWDDNLVTVFDVGKVSILSDISSIREKGFIQDDETLDRLEIYLDFDDVEVRIAAARTIIEEVVLLNERGEDLRLRALEVIKPHLEVNVDGPIYGQVDLHTHTHHSDAYQTASALVLEGYEAGLDLIAVADHNVLTSDEAIEAARILGVNLICGVEATCNFEGSTVHMLIHFPSRDIIEILGPEGQRILDKLKKMDETDSIRAAQIRENMVRFLGSEFEVTPEEVQAASRGKIRQLTVMQALWRKNPDLIRSLGFEDPAKFFIGFIKRHEEPINVDPDLDMSLTIEETARLAYELDGRLVLAHPNELDKDGNEALNKMFRIAKALASIDIEGKVIEGILAGIEFYSHKLKTSGLQPGVGAIVDNLNSAYPVYQKHNLILLPGSDHHGKHSPQQPLGSENNYPEDSSDIEEYVAFIRGKREILNQIRISQERIKTAAAERDLRSRHDDYPPDDPLSRPHRRLVDRIERGEESPEDWIVLRRNGNIDDTVYVAQKENLEGRSIEVLCAAYAALTMRYVSEFKRQNLSDPKFKDEVILFLGDDAEHDTESFRLALSKLRPGQKPVVLARDESQKNMVRTIVRITPLDVPRLHMLDKKSLDDVEIMTYKEAGLPAMFDFAQVMYEDGYGIEGIDNFRFVPLSEVLEKYKEMADSNLDV